MQLIQYNKNNISPGPFLHYEPLKEKKTKKKNRKGLISINRQNILFLNNILYPVNTRWRLVGGLGYRNKIILNEGDTLDNDGQEDIYIEQEHSTVQ